MAVYKTDKAVTECEINGIQQVGVGTCSFEKSRDWFKDRFGFDVRILEDDTVAERMLPYTGGKAQQRHAGINVNLNGGGGLEIWQYSHRTPVSPAQTAAAGDLGIFAARLKCRNICLFREFLLKNGCAPSEPTETPDHKPCMYVPDLYGNIFQIVEESSTFIRQKHLCGGVTGALVGVSDMERSLKFYSEVLGYDTVVYDVTGTFKEWASLKGGEQNFRRVLLKRSKTPSGAFSPLFGPDSVELVQALDRTPVKLYEGRFWGDPGFIQICYDVRGMDALGRRCAALGHPFTVDSCPTGEIFNMGDAAGRFTYVEDPDGTLIEFVETFKVPVYKKAGWYIDMSKREAGKPLPRFLFKAMGLTSRLK